MRLHFAVVAALALLLCACTTYTYRGTKYGSREQATAAIQADLANSLANVKPVENRLGGRAIVAIPDRTVMQANGVRTPGGTAPSSDAVGYLVDSLETTYLAYVDGLKRGQVFDDVMMIRDADPNGVLIGDHDFKIWLTGESFEQWQWYVARHGSAEREPASIDRGLAPIERLNSFNVAVVKAAVHLGAKPAVGK